MKHLNWIAASKRYAVLGEALEAHGIDPDAEDPKAAIGAKLAAATAADPALVAKAAQWDKFCAQAKAEGLDADAMVASESGLKDRVDTVAREVLKTHLKENAPTNTEHTEASPVPPAGADGKAKAAHYQALVAKGDKDAASAFYTAHSHEFLAHLNLDQEG